MKIHVYKIHKDFITKEIWISCDLFYPTITATDLKRLLQRGNYKLKVFERQQHQIIYDIILKK